MTTTLDHQVKAGIAEQATGCQGAGSYADYADSKGYGYCEVLDWTSSAGDWQFLVSKDGKTWYILDQTNNYPGYRFTWTISDGIDDPDWIEFFEGDIESVYKQIEALW